MTRKRIYLIFMSLCLALAIAALPFLAACIPEPSPPDIPTKPPTTPAITAFRYTVYIKLRDMPIQMSVYQEGNVQTTNKREYARLQYEIESLSQDSELVREGEARWVRGNLPFIDLDFNPTHYLDEPGTREALTDQLASLSGVPEKVNGVDALRYELSGDKFYELAGIPVSGSDSPDPPSASLWVAKDLGIPVKLIMEASSKSEPGSIYTEINVMNLNDPNITINLPSEGVVGISYTTPQESTYTLQYDDEGPSIWDWIEYAVRGLIEAATGGFEPGAFVEVAEIAAENVEDAKAKTEIIEQWREANPDDPTVGRAFREPDKFPEEKNWVYDWFWGLIQ